MVVGRHLSGPHAELYNFLEADLLDDALRTAVLLERKGTSLTRDILYRLLQICTKKKDLAAARQIRSLMNHSQLHHIVCLSDYFIRLFALCGSLPEATDVFEKVEKPTCFTWNAIISAHGKFGDGVRALDLYGCMLESGQQPDKVTFLSVLKACNNAGALKEARLIHHQVIVRKIDADLAIGNTLVDMYAKCGSLEEAQNVFRMVRNRNVVSWDAIIGGYAQYGQGIAALQLFHEMQQEGIPPDRITFLGVLKACCCFDTTSEGLLIHEWIIKAGLESEVTVASTLVDMYAKCGCLEDARNVFDSMCYPNLVSWACMISGYAQYGEGFEALLLFDIMEKKGLRSDKYVYSGVLKACGVVQDVGKGRLVHERVVKAMLESGEVIGNTLVDMYAKCGNLSEAQKIFDSLGFQNVAAWGSMITGYAEFGDGLLALKAFNRMQQADIQPSKVTYLCAVKACSCCPDKQAGDCVYHGLFESSLEQDVLIGSALVDLFAKSGKMEEARHIFDRLKERNLVTWGAMLTGYAQQERSLPALELYEELQLEQMEPNRVIFLSTLKSCCSIGTWGLSGIIHSHIIKNNLESDLALGNALIDMYARRGSLQEAQRVFDKLPTRDIISYSSMITGYADCGDCKIALECLECMCKQGLKPDVIIFTSILAACSHAGLINEAYSIFNQMRVDYDIVPDMGHFTCIIDLLGSGGRLREAEALIDTIHVTPDLAIWRSLLLSSRVYKDVELGNKCFEHAVRLDPEDASIYTLMTSIYLDANRWDKAQDIQEQRIRAGARKKPGKACIDINNNNYEFVVGEGDPVTSNESSSDKEKLLVRSMREDGYMPQLELVQNQTLNEEIFSEAHELFEWKKVVEHPQQFKQIVHNTHSNVAYDSQGLFVFPHFSTIDSNIVTVACA